MFRYGGGTSNTWLSWQRCLPYEAHNFISITNCAEAEITHVQSKYEICAGVVTEIAIVFRLSFFLLLINVQEHK